MVALADENALEVALRSFEVFQLINNDQTNHFLHYNAFPKQCGQRAHGVTQAFVSSAPRPMKRMMVLTQMVR